MADSRKERVDRFKEYVAALNMQVGTGCWVVQDMPAAPPEPCAATATLMLPRWSPFHPPTLRWDLCGVM